MVSTALEIHQANVFALVNGAACVFNAELTTGHQGGVTRKHWLCPPLLHACEIKPYRKERFTNKLKF